MSFGAYVSSDTSLSLFLCSLTKGFVEETELFLPSLTNLFFLLGMFDFGCFFLFFIFKCQVICSSTRGALELIVIFAISSEIENYCAFIKNYKTLIHIKEVLWYNSYSWYVRFSYLPRHRLQIRLDCDSSDYSYVIYCWISYDYS